MKLNIDLEKFHIEPITKRWIYPYVLYTLARELERADKELPVYMGQVNFSQNNLVNMYWIWKDGDIEKYLAYYSENMSVVENKIKKRLSELKKLNLKRKKNTNDIIYCLDGLAFGLRMSLILRGIDLATQPKLRNFLSEDKLGVACAFEEDAFTTREEISLLELSKSKLNREEKSKILKEIYEEYKWTYYGIYNESPKNFEEYTRDFFTLQNPDQKLKEIKTRKKAILTEKNEILGKLSNEQKNLVKIEEISSLLKDYQKIIMNYSIGIFGEIMSGIAKERRISLEDIKLLSEKEILDFVDGKDFDFREIHKRNELYVLVANTGNYLAYFGKEAEMINSTYLKQDKSQLSELKGRVASRGHAKGKARIILGQNDFHKLEQGDILVVSNTTPDYVPIMKKSSAIVAEEGGLTAHVSVVSREFGIPCVVGVKNITNILKDGDLVEVDANKGIVKILEKAK